MSNVHDIYYLNDIEMLLSEIEDIITKEKNLVFTACRKEIEKARLYLKQDDVKESAKHLKKSQRVSYKGEGISFKTSKIKYYSLFKKIV